ncbi:S-layer homology domain-containing protein [Paenibacillus sp. FSL H8-0537]|uniref:S-layer homology domain-containing protein n=1 Tax=Paenibacillus sp. FSL H8-0537 TaxID=2921399 RepID=UPI0031019C95
MKMKSAKLIMLIVLALFLQMAWPGSPIQQIHAAALVSGDFEYENNGNGTATITKYLGSAGYVNIPKSINGLNVTIIGSGSFARSQLTSVTIPDGVTFIGAQAFYFSQLTSVSIPYGVYAIGVGAFSNSQLRSVTIPDSVKRIFNDAFSHNQLTSLVIPEGVTDIDSGAFSYNQLTSLSIPDGVRALRADVFSHNELTSISLPDSIYEIYQNAFSYNQLTSLTLPVGVFGVAGEAFSNNQLSKVLVKGDSTYINHAAFSDNPSGLTLIGYDNAEQFADAQGYSFERFAPINVDFSPDGNLNWQKTHSTDVNISLPSLPGTEIIKYQWSTSAAIPLSGAWNLFDSNVSIAAPTQTGQWHLHVWAKDSNGFDFYYVSHPFFIDVTPPDIVLTTATPSSNQSVSVTASVYDSHSGTVETKWATGIQSVSYFEQSGTTLTLIDNKATLSIAENSWLSIYVKDQAGNEYVKQVQIVSPSPLPSSGGAGGGSLPIVSGNTDIKQVNVLVNGKALVLNKISDTAYTAETEASQITLSPDVAANATKVTAYINGKSVSLDSPIDLKEGDNRIEVTVQAADGATKTYTITIVRKAQPSAPNTSTFTDVNEHWASEAIQEMTASGIVSGYPDGSFRPNAPVTRAEFVVMIMKAAGTNTGNSGGAASFTDGTAISTWAKSAVEEAVSKGIVSGYADGSFRPKERITRAELVTMVARAFNIAVVQGDSSFTDSASIPNWASGAAEALKQKGVLQGRKDGQFDGQAEASRAEAITILWQLLSSQS